VLVKLTDWLPLAAFDPAKLPPPPVHVTGSVALALVIQESTVEPPDETLVGEPVKVSVGATFAAPAGLDGCVIGIVVGFVVGEVDVVCWVVVLTGWVDVEVEV
jgi:hypothetical protein